MPKKELTSLEKLYGLKLFQEKITEAVIPVSYLNGARIYAKILKKN